jgi:hypothetical protein
VRDLLPVTADLRPYTPDLQAALQNGFGGTTSGYYDANGHFMRAQIVSAADAPGADLNNILGGPIPPAGLHTGHHSRCPGGATQPAPDKSNPRIEDPSLCNPKDDVGAG